MAVNPEDLPALLTRLQSDLTGLVNLLRSIRDYAPRSGRVLSGTIVAGDLSVTLPHGLGRAFVGVDVRHAANLATALTAEPPATNTHVTLYLGATQANDVTFTVWVY